MRTSVHIGLQWFLHELLHLLGHAFHANSYECKAGEVDPFTCDDVEYGDQFDIMGGADYMPWALSVRSRYLLGWVDGSSLAVVQESQHVSIAAARFAKGEGPLGEAIQASPDARSKNGAKIEAVVVMAPGTCAIESGAKDAHNFDRDSLWLEARVTDDTGMTLRELNIQDDQREDGALLPGLSLRRAHRLIDSDLRECKVNNSNLATKENCRLHTVIG